MEEDEIITQMGIMLTQLRFARRALEDIAASTERYGGFAFASALSEGPSFGEPPLLNGALKVYIVNIQDLAPGSGFGGFLEGLLGGIGRFFGGFIGGIAGGAVSAVSLPGMLVRIDNIAQTIDRILDRLGVGTGEQVSDSARRSTGQQQPAAGSGGTDLMTQLRGIRDLVGDLTALFRAAAGERQESPRRSDIQRSRGSERWMATFRSIQEILRGVSHVVDGLIILVPILLGSLVLLIQRLDAIKLAVIEMLQFIMRNVFLLRGVILTTVYDTVAAAARMAGNVLGILGASVERILSAIFRMIGHVLNGAVAALRFLANGLQNTIDRLLRWLVGSLGAVLTQIGDLRIFRVLVHVIRILPAVLPPLYELLRGESPPLSPTQMQALTDAAALTIPGPSRTGRPGPEIPGFPDLGQAIAPPAQVAALSTALSTASRGLTGEMRGIFGTAQGTLYSLGQELNRSVRQETEFSRTRLQDNLRLVVQRSDELARALSSAQTAARRRPETGLEAIARAYEQWLGGGGLRTLLGNITQHFRSTPPAQTGSIPHRIAAEGVERPQATVDIQDVVIEIAPPAETGEESQPRREPEIERPRPTELAHLGSIFRQLRELSERGDQMGVRSLLDHAV